jgi:hypothetical protein
MIVAGCLMDSMTESHDDWDIVCGLMGGCWHLPWEDREAYCKDDDGSIEEEGSEEEEDSDVDEEEESGGSPPGMWMDDYRRVDERRLAEAAEDRRVKRKFDDLVGVCVLSRAFVVGVSRPIVPPM